MKKLLLALAVSLAMTSGAQALETSVKPQVTDLGVQPQSYMLVGNSFTFYSLNFPKNLHSNTGTGDYFPKKVISS